MDCYSPYRHFVVETLVEEESEIEMKGYKILLPATKGQRGIVIAVRKELEKITSIVMEDIDPAEQMWIQIANGKINLRIGLIYAPQESRTKLDVLKIMYKKIEQQIIKGKEKDQKIMIMGDFNCKVAKRNTKQHRTSYKRRKTTKNTGRKDGHGNTQCTPTV